jgi:iron complex outermembrane receptor protein
VQRAKNRTRGIKHCGRGIGKYGLIIALLVGSTWITRGALASTKVSFDVPAGPASETLFEFQRQAGLALLFDPNLDVRTKQVRGLLAPKKALSILLAGTGLTAEFLDDKRVSVKLLPHPDRRSDRNTSAGVSHKALEEVTIKTGTHIPYGPLVGLEPIIIDQSEISTSGATTVADLLRKLPQNFDGGPSEDTHLIGAETRSNSGLGIGMNLRGLGSRATLVLLNGRRVAPSGNEASFSDVLSIPLSAIERIEVLLDGASALYGSDAVGGVVNFITRDGYTGAETFGSVGSVTKGSQSQYRLYQLFGREWSTGSIFVSIEAYHRHALAAADRPYVTSNLTPFGGPNFDTMASNPGTIRIGNQTYAIPKGQNGVGLDLQSLTPGTSNLSDIYDHADVLPAQDFRSFYAALHHDVSDAAAAFGTFLWSDRRSSERHGGRRIDSVVPGSNPFLLNRPTGADPVHVLYDLLQDLGPVINDADVGTYNLTLGLNVSLGSRWHLSTSVAEVIETEHQSTRGEIDPTALDTALLTAFNPFGDGSNTDSGTLLGIRAAPVFNSKSELRDFYCVAEGPLHRLPGGELRAAFGAELRHQRFVTELSPPPIGSDLRRQLVAGFVELKAPFSEAENSRPGLRRLDLSVAARFEHYSDFGRTVTPKIGLTWSPLSGLELFGTWGKATRAPNPGDLDEHSNVAFSGSLPDSSSKLGSSEALVLSGKNARLSAESATSATFGVGFTPTGFPGLRFKATYFHIIFKDRIQNTDFEPNLLNDPRVQSIVTRNPSAALLEQICNDANNHFNGSQAQCLQTPIDAIVDLRDRNLGTLRTEGIDFTPGWVFDTAWGHIDFELNSAYLLDYSQIDMPHDPWVSLLNTENNPINLHVTSVLKWEWRHLWTRLGMDYANGYQDVASEPHRNISSWTTFDLGFGYRFGSRASSDNTEIAVTVLNVFDRAPPFVINRSAQLGYDEENADPTGRTVGIWIRRQW